MNRVGSSKAVKSVLEVDMLVSGTTEKARISKIVMDEVSITMAKISKSVLYVVAKRDWHRSYQRTVGYDLYVLQKKHHIFS